MLNKEQQWRLVLAGHYNSLPDIDVVRQFENLSVQTTEVPPEQDSEVFSYRFTISILVFRVL